jgi:chemotaxis protein MotA
MSAILGLIFGIVVVFFANYMEGDPYQALLSMDGAMIVFGGTFCAMLTHAGLSDLMTAVKYLRWLMKPPRVHAAGFISQVAEWSDIVRKKSVLSLQDTAESLEDRFLKIGLQTIIDGKKFDELRDMLYLVGDVEDREYAIAGEIWEAAGGYAPTIGVLGAVLGLIHVMRNLNHPSSLGGGIAVAFIATVYGVGSANLILIPLGARMKKIAGMRAVFREIATEGLLLLSKGIGPIAIRATLENLLESRRGAAEAPAEAGAVGDPAPAAGE